MEISELCLLHLFLCLYFLPFIICRSNYRYNMCSNTNGNYINSSIYKNGLSLCRGDLLEQDCHACLKDATNDFPTLCPTQKEAVAWYETCMLRYSNHILSELVIISLGI